MTHILVTNDDGVDSPGLLALKQALEPVGRVSVIAPDRNRSAIARGITIHNPLHVEEVRLADGSPAFATDGTPVDCVRFATLGLLDTPPDLIVSGINLGLNLGDDVTYSGTVAAALEGVLLGCPAIAVSAQADRPRTRTSGTAPPTTSAPPPSFAARLVPLRAARATSRAGCCSTSTPRAGRPRTSRGARVTRLGRRIYNDVLVLEAERGRRRALPIYGESASYHPEEGTDFAAIEPGEISVTPLHFDLTDIGGMDALERWRSADLLEPSGAGRVPVTGFDPVLFDLDGTVIDSVALIRESHRHAVRTVLGEDCRTRCWWPTSAGRSSSRCAPSPPTAPRSCYRVYREWNHAHTARPAARVRRASSEVLDALRRRRAARWASSPRRATTRSTWPSTCCPCRAAFRRGDRRRGHRRATSPTRTPVREALERLGAGAEGACYVGDAPFDLRAGRAAGVATIAVTWGFFPRRPRSPRRPRR